MNRLRVAVLCHSDLIPPDSLEGLSDAEVDPFRTRFPTKPLTLGELAALAQWRSE